VALRPMITWKLSRIFLIDSGRVVWDPIPSVSLLGITVIKYSAPIADDSAASAVTMLISVLVSAMSRTFSAGLILSSLVIIRLADRTT